MTDCAKIQELISALLDGELSAEEEALVKEHIENCTECAKMYEMFALVSGDISSLAEPPADLKDKVMAGITPAKKKKGIIVSLRPYMTAAACLVLVIGIFAAGRGGFGMSANDTAAPRAADVNFSSADSAEMPMAQTETYGYSYEAEEEAVCDEASPAESEDGAILDTNGTVSAPESVENIYRGTVVDRAMSKVNENDFTGRAYIGIEFDDGTGTIFWLARGYELPDGIEIGSYVEIESEYEKSTGLLVATKVSLFPDRSGIKYYCLDKDSEHTSPTIALYDNGEFSIIFSDLSSYIGIGTYEIADDRLTLNTVEGTVYVFDIMSDSIVFDADASTGYGFDDGDVLEGA